MSEAVIRMMKTYRVKSNHFCGMNNITPKDISICRACDMHTEEYPAFTERKQELLLELIAKNFDISISFQLDKYIIIATIKLTDFRETSTIISKGVQAYSLEDAIADITNELAPHIDNVEVKRILKA